jgi:hypothetical protein
LKPCSKPEKPECRHDDFQSLAERQRRDIFVVCRPKPIQAPSGAAYSGRFLDDAAPDGASFYLEIIELQKCQP